MLMPIREKQVYVILTRFFQPLVILSIFRLFKCWGLIKNEKFINSLFRNSCNVVHCWHNDHADLLGTQGI